ncbi:nuclease-related domain-containing protein [Arthrobacter sp. FB24]|uniref:nuclease-related domain-containing protein n=1 Tax=Arthrobacter sp. (strain FB24) TaxID=290399 RepID=UPI000A01363E|nr:nuclease-related domain-containing protein [Arthrobacter sp. FB24]
MDTSVSAVGPALATPAAVPDEPGTQVQLSQAPGYLGALTPAVSVAPLEPDPVVRQPRSVTVWLAGMEQEGYRVLHSVPLSPRKDIDHLVIGPTGIHAHP